MKLNKKEFIEQLLKKSAKINVILDEKQLEQLFLYKEMLIEWNEKINLTAITDDEEIIVKHFIDCLECVKYIKKGSSVIDIGTGAGLPGIIIAIYLKGESEITLLDSLNKRISFLERVVQKLNIKNISLICGRAEELAKIDRFREKYDVAVSRAVAKLNVLLEYTIPFVKIESIALYMKSSKLQEEVVESKNALKVLESKVSNKYEYMLINKGKRLTRYILEIRKLKKTKDMYPRCNKNIKKSPL